MRHSTRVAKFGTFVVAAALAIACLDVSPANAAPASSPDYSTNREANAIAAKAAESIAADLGQDADYAGVRIEAGGVVVSLVGSTSDRAKTSFRRAQDVANPSIRATFGSSLSLPVGVEAASRSQATLERLTGQILTDQSQWKSKGVVLSSWGPDIVSNTVKVNLANYSVAAAKALASTYGTAVTVSGGDLVAGASSREADFAPWFGGSHLYNGSNGAPCTSWFPATRNSDGKSVMLTAGHCGNGTWYQNGNLFGTTSSLTYVGRDDSQVIPVTSNSARIFSDPTSTTRTVAGVALSDPIGTLVCTEGYVDKEVCSVRIDAIGQTVTWTGDGHTTTGLVAAHQTAGKLAFSGGDSGGPVGATSGSTSIYAYGMLVGRVLANPSIGWYVPARVVQVDMGVSIKL